MYKGRKSILQNPQIMHEKAANSHFESTNAILQQSMIQSARKKNKTGQSDREVQAYIHDAGVNASKTTDKKKAAFVKIFNSPDKINK